MSDKPSLGGQLDALWRQGLKDLQNAVLPAFPTSQQGVQEPGAPLSPTSQMVTADLQQPGPDPGPARADFEAYLHHQQARTADRETGPEAGLGAGR